MKSYKELEIWQKSIDLSLKTYQITSGFPPDEKYGLTSQLRRSAVSIPSNIAEGWGRNSKKEFIHFLNIAKASCMELETQLIISSKLNIVKPEQLEDMNHQLESIIMMINKLISKLKTLIR